MSNLKFQRDEFINTIYNKAKKNKNIYFLSADFGAPALDQFRENLKKQFIHLGICEQNMVDFANGLALEGKKVYIYAHPEVTARLCGDDLDIIDTLEERFGTALLIRSENNYHVEQYEIFSREY